jgi:ribosomal protein L18E
VVAEELEETERMQPALNQEMVEQQLTITEVYTVEEEVEAVMLQVLGEDMVQLSLEVTAVDHQQLQKLVLEEAEVHTLQVVLVQMECLS